VPRTDTRAYAEPLARTLDLSSSRMAVFVQNEQTLCIKPVSRHMVDRIMRAVRDCATSPKLGVSSVADKDPACAGQFLVYANYASARDAGRARDALETWVADKWPASLGSPRPRIMLKAEMGSVYFAVYVANAPPGTTPGELERLFQGYGRLHTSPCISAIRGSDDEFFVNFATFEGAHAVLQAALRRELRFGGSVLVANAARNTQFINELMDTMRGDGRYSFALDDARRIGERMSDWSPTPISIEALLRAIPASFVLDRQTRLFHLIDRSAPLSPHQSAPPASSPPRPSNRAPSPLVYTEEEGRAMKQNTDAMNHFLHDNVDVLHDLFLKVWFAAYGDVWVDSDGWASSSAAVLQQELCLGHLPPVMLEPIADWDLTTLASALNATSLKATLASMWTRAGIAADSDATHARCMVLVEERMVSSHEDLQKYLGSFSAAGTSPTAAVQTIRFLRNILSHLKGSVTGLPARCFILFCELASEALSTLAAMLGCGHTERVKMRRALLLLGAAEAPPRSRSSSPDCAGSTRDDDCISVCSTVSAGSAGQECRNKVKDWSVDQVLGFFASCKFPTAGVSAGQVDGTTLLSLWEHSDVEAIFTAPAPDGMGFNKLMYLGRLKQEMICLLANDSSPRL